MANSISKKALAIELAKKRNVTVTESKSILDDVFGLVEDHLISGNDVALKGLFTFKQTKKPARTGVGFGTSWATPETKTVKLLVGSTLKEKMNK